MAYLGCTWEKPDSNKFRHKRNCSAPGIQDKLQWPNSGRTRRQHQKQLEPRAQAPSRLSSLASSLFEVLYTLSPSQAFSTHTYFFTHGSSSFIFYTSYHLQETSESLTHLLFKKKKKTGKRTVGPAQSGTHAWTNQHWPATQVFSTGWPGGSWLAGSQEGIPKSEWPPWMAVLDKVGTRVRVGGKLHLRKPESVCR